MKTQEKMLRLLAFLRDYEISGKSFTFHDLAEVTGYTLSTIQTYERKKLRGYLLIRKHDGMFLSQGIKDLSDEQFFNHMGQRSQEVSHSVEERSILRIIRRSLDAFILALEVYNRPSLDNRVEAFAILMINAWELLLKGDIIKTSGYNAIFYPNTPRSLSVRDMLKKTMKENDPVRHNIEMLVDLRDDAIHLLIPALQVHLSRLCQASVLNFVKQYKDMTGQHPLSRQSIGLISLVVDSPVPELAQILHDYGHETATRVAQFLQIFSQAEKEHSSLSFSIPIEYKLVLSKKASEGDLTLSLSDGGEKAVLVEVPKDIDQLYPYREKEAIEVINTRLPMNQPINRHTFRAVIAKHNIKGNHQYHYKISRPETHLFSNAFIEWFLQRVSSNEKWLSESVEFYRHYMSRKKKS